MKPPFYAALIVPTGIGCAIGGHAGDAGPVARLLAGACDTLLIHPNVVNASDINEMPANSLYVEGSILDTFLWQKIALQPVLANRVLVLLENHPESEILDAAINTVNAARATWGLRCSEIVILPQAIGLRAFYDTNGCASGTMADLDPLYQVIAARTGTFDAIALASVIDVPPNYHQFYFADHLSVNPWGAVEAKLTKAISARFAVPSAHAPMLESERAHDFTIGQVDPRKAAEAISTAFFHCVLKGLARAPAIAQRGTPHGLDPEHLVAIILPHDCGGPAAEAALQNGYAVIAVRENRNLMKTDLSKWNWQPDQFWPVHNYWEAAGILLAMRQGICPHSVRRPLSPAALSNQ